MHLKSYKVTYGGSWMGGKAVVVAYDAEEAIDLVKNDNATINFTDVNAECIVDVITEPVVIYNDNGEY